MQQVAKLVELQAQLQRHKHEMRLNNCKTKTGNGDETGSLLYCLGLGLEPRFGLSHSSFSYSDTIP